MLAARLLLVTLLGSLSLVSAHPALFGRKEHHDDPEVKIMDEHCDKDAAGAAYFMTNEPTGRGNYIVVAGIAKDGKLKYCKAVSTRGLGAHGNANPNGPNALFSQSSVSVNHVGKVMAVVNAGSHTVSLFAIDPNKPTEIKQLGQPMASGGDFPVSVAISQGGNSACVLNGGYLSTIRCFTIDQNAGLVPKTGTLRAIELNQATTPPSGPDGTASDIIFTEDGGHLIVAVKGKPGSPGHLLIWDVASDGTLSKEYKTVPVPSGGQNPSSLTLIKGKNAFVSADPAKGVVVFDVSGVHDAPAKGTAPWGKSSAISVDGHKAISWSTVSEKTGNYYFSDSQTSVITEVQVDGELKASVVKQHDQKVNPGFMDLRAMTIGDKDFLFVLAPGTNSIEVLQLEKGKDPKRVGSGFPWQEEVKKTDLVINANNIQGLNVFIK